MSCFSCFDPNIDYTAMQLHVLTAYLMHISADAVWGHVPCTRIFWDPIFRGRKQEARIQEKQEFLLHFYRRYRMLQIEQGCRHGIYSRDLSASAPLNLSGPIIRSLPMTGVVSRLPGPFTCSANPLLIVGIHYDSLRYPACFLFPHAGRKNGFSQHSFRHTVFHYVHAHLHTPY